MTQISLGILNQSGSIVFKEKFKMVAAAKLNFSGSSNAHQEWSVSSTLSLPEIAKCLYF